MADLRLTDAEPAVAADGVWLSCIECGETFAPFEAVRYTCDDCEGLLEVRYADPPTWDDFDDSRRGVWRYAAASRSTRGSRCRRVTHSCTTCPGWRPKPASTDSG